jgi:DNA-3-methyladenine glycosylase II
MIPTTTLRTAETHLRGRDRKLARLIDHCGPCTLGRARRDPFHVLCGSIISQQLSTKAADTIQARIAAATGAGKRFAPAHFLDFEHEQLRACGLSTAKARWLKALAQAVHHGELSFEKLRRLDDEAAIEALDALPGVGRWTAEMMLIFALDRLDVFSLGDVGLRRSVNRLYNGGEPLDDEATLKITARWAPYRSIGSWYMWRMIDGVEVPWA